MNSFMETDYSILDMWLIDNAALHQCLRDIQYSQPKGISFNDWIEQQAAREMCFDCREHTRGWLIDMHVLIMQQLFDQARRQKQNYFNELWTEKDRQQFNDFVIQNEHLLQELEEYIFNYDKYCLYEYEETD